MKTRRQIDGRYGKVYDTVLTKEYLIQKYTIENLSTYMIANEVGCSPKIVYNYIDTYNIPRISHKKLKELTDGQVFGLLTTVRSVTKSKNGTLLWECLCACGNTTIVPSSRLKSHRVKSCGCWRQRKKNHKWKGFCDVSGNRIAEIRLRAKKKNIEFSLTPEFLWNLYVAQDKKCSISGIDITMNIDASVDRTDSAKGYVEDNVTWVHKDINKMKMDLSLSQFLEYCNIISKHNQPQKEV